MTTISHATSVRHQSSIKRTRHTICCCWCFSFFFFCYSKTVDDQWTIIIFEWTKKKMCILFISSSLQSNLIVSKPKSMTVYVYALHWNTKHRKHKPSSAWMQHENMEKKKFRLCFFVLMNSPVLHENIRINAIKWN